MTKLSISNSFLKPIIFLMVFITTSCGSNINKDNVKPDDLIPKEEFINIMVDIRMIETSIRQKIGKGKNLNKTTEYYYNYLFEKYKISPKRFNSSLNYYSNDVKEMHDINVSVVEKLTQMESEVKAQKKAE